MALTSDELNFLIYRYLRESGFEHSAYAFGHESFVYKSTLDGSGVPPGALISFVQKGLQYVDIEQHLTDDGSELLCDEPVTALKKHHCRMPSNKRPLYAPYDPIDADYGGLEIDGAVRVVPQAALLAEGREREERMKAIMTTAMAWQPHQPIVALGGQDGRIRVWEMKEELSTAEEKGADRKRGRQYSLVRVLDEAGQCVAEEEEERSAREMRRKGHKRIKAAPPTSASSPSSAASSPPSSPHSVLSLDWHPRTNALAAGFYSGDVVVYSPKGDVLHRLQHHSAPISVVRWNRSGERLLTASVDQSVCVWSDGKIVQQFLVHTGPVIDADWSPAHDGVCCTVGTDGCVFLYQLGGSGSVQKEPRRLMGHVGDVNSVRFDVSGQFVATGGDDCSARVWSRESGECVQDMRDHQRPISVVRWTTAESSHTQSASSSSSSSSSSALLLATASLDCTIRLYDISSAKALHTLARHAHPITSLSFQSGAGGLLVSGSHDRVHIWSVADGALVKTFRSEGEGGVNEVQWDASGRRIMVTYADSWNFLLDLKG